MSQENRSKPEPVEPAKELSRAIGRYQDELDGLANTFSMVMEVVQASVERATDAIDKFEKHIEAEGRREADGAFILNGREEVDRFETLRSDYRDAAIAQTVVPRSLIIMMVSAYDTYLSRLVRAMYLAQPQMLEGSDRSVTFSQLANFASIEDARNYVVDREAETLLRSSHAEQFRFLEKRLGLKLIDELDRWAFFIEITERRNLFVHADGVVGDQYLNVCAQAAKGRKLAPREVRRVGERLRVDPGYFALTRHVLYELGVKLGQTIWRKVCPDLIDKADDALLRTVYELLVARDYNLATHLCVFALDLKGKASISDAENRLMFTVNLAIAYRLKGEQSKSVELVRSCDWSACESRFKLAAAVLLDENDRAYELMKRIGSSGEISKDHYRTWPLFEQLRAETRFIALFKEIFGEPLMSVSTTDRELHGID